MELEGFYAIKNNTATINIPVTTNKRADHNTHQWSIFTALWWKVTRKKKNLPQQKKSPWRSHISKFTQSVNKLPKRNSQRKMLCENSFYVEYYVKKKTTLHINIPSTLYTRRALHSQVEHQPTHIFFSCLVKWQFLIEEKGHYDERIVSNIFFG